MNVAGFVSLGRLFRRRAFVGVVKNRTYLLAKGEIGVTMRDKQKTVNAVVPELIFLDFFWFSDEISL
jgi:hypothetical protein